MSLADVVARAGGSRALRWLTEAQEQAQAAREAGGPEAQRRHWEREMDRIRRGKPTDMEQAVEKNMPDGVDSP